MKKLVILILAITSSYFTVSAQSEINENHFIEKVLSGNVYFADKQVVINDLVWNPHPIYKGVYLKHLIIGNDTENQLSCHIVKVDPNCILEPHLHDGKIEIHEVVAGSGTMFLDKKEINYTVGQICVIPANMQHSVVAGKDGLILFAKFTPAL
jgi:Uncharacterized conserved protein, contains double-stranded beta-helix domain